MNQPARIRITHFHIRWVGVERLDWEPFGTREQAEARAKELARSCDKFAIEEYDQSCARCGCKSAVAS